MTVSNSTQSSAASAASSSTATGATSPKDLSQTFLKLLVAQLNNQDPLNPVDNSQITTQMAQISTVTGIGNLNTTVNQLVSQMQQSSAIQSAQLSGHSVMVSGDALNLASTGSGSSVAALGGINLDGAASSVTVTVKDTAGNTVRTLQLGAKPQGFSDFTWDGSTDAGGTATAGNYTYQVAATGSSGTVTATAYNAATVVGAVPQTDGSTQLLLGDGSQVAYSAIKQIL
jgi:flagellar basal-body rod modification protein FlgD